MYYLVSSLNDGTVLAACPIRKPLPKVLKRWGSRIDADGVAQESMRNGKELGNWEDPGRIRFLDLIASNLNTRRAIRELAGKPLDELREQVAALRAEVVRLNAALAARV